MDKKKLINFINQRTSVGFLATLDGKIPRVRPIAARVSGEKLLFSTFTRSSKMDQIASNNNVEMAWLLPDMSQVRIQATAHEINSKDTKKRFLEEQPDLQEYFKNENDPNYTLLELKPERVNYNKLGELDYSQIRW